MNEEKGKWLCVITPMQWSRRNCAVWREDSWRLQIKGSGYQEKLNPLRLGLCNIMAKTWKEAPPEGLEYIVTTSANPAPPHTYISHKLEWFSDWECTECSSRMQGYVGYCKSKKRGSWNVNPAKLKGEPDTGYSSGSRWDGVWVLVYLFVTLIVIFLMQIGCSAKHNTAYPCIYASLCRLEVYSFFF